jgi:hypothetical protein
MSCIWQYHWVSLLPGKLISWAREIMSCHPIHLGVSGGGSGPLNSSGIIWGIISATDSAAHDVACASWWTHDGAEHTPHRLTGVYKIYRSLPQPGRTYREGVVANRSDPPRMDYRGAKIIGCLSRTCITLSCLHKKERIYQCQYYMTPTCLCPI